MNHHKLIKSLINEIRELRNFNLFQHKKMERINQQLRNENDRVEIQREYERQEHQSKEWQREDLINDLEKHERMGNEWEATRIKKELRNF